MNPLMAGSAVAHSQTATPPARASLSARGRLLEGRRLEVGAVQRGAAPSASGTGHGGELLKARDGHHRKGAILCRGFLGRQIVGAILAERVSRRGALPASARGRRLLRGNLGRQAGDDDNLAVNVQALVGVRLGLLGGVAVSHKDQTRGKVERLQRRRATAGGHGPILGVLQIRGARPCRSSRGSATRPAAASTAPRRRRRRNRSLALFRRDLPGDQFHGREVRLQRTPGIRRAPSGLEPPFRQMAGDIEGGRIEAARWKAPPFQLIGGEEVVVDLHFFLADGIRVAIAGLGGGHGLTGFRFGLRRGVGRLHGDKHGQRKNGQQKAAHSDSAHRAALLRPWGRRGGGFLARLGGCLGRADQDVGVAAFHAGLALDAPV